MAKKAKAVKSADRTPGVFSTLLQDYLRYIVQTKGGSTNTQDSYRVTFRLLIIYIWETMHVSIEMITFSMLTVKIIEGFLVWLAESRGNAFNTVNLRLAAIKSFSKYATNHNFEAAASFHTEMDKIERKRGIENERAFFTTEEVKILLDLPKLNTIAGRRDVTLLTFMYASGARAEEVCNLQVRDVRIMEDGTARVCLDGKGGKKRTIAIGSDTVGLLQKYMRYRRIMDLPDAYVFNTQNHPQMSIGCIEAIYKKYVTMAKNEYPNLFHEKSYPPHSMRHTTAVSMLEAGVPLTVIKVFLGHSSIATTEIYAKITQPSLDESVLNWNSSFWSHMTIESKEALTQDVPDEKDDYIPDFLK